jgi:hypothetical protein
MKMQDCNVIVVRTFSADHVQKGGYWLSWYMENVIRDDANLGRIRGYWRGDCLDAILVPDTETATDVALTYSGPLSERVRYIAACLALGENPDGDGGQPVTIDAKPLPVAPGGQAVTLDSLMN